MFRLTAFLAAALAALPAAAQSPWYAGLSGGQARTDRELVANRESTITTATNLSTAFDARDTAWKAYAGFRFNPVIAVEVGYADLGSHHMLTTMQGGDPPFPAAIAIDRKISGYGIDLVATPPVGLSRVTLHGRVGAFQSRLEALATLSGNIVFTGGDPDERSRRTTRQETVLRFGAGVDVALARNLSARLEWERYAGVGKAFAVGGTGTTGEADTDAVWLGVVARF